jgi:hypothetical protein
MSNADPPRPPPEISYGSPESFGWQRRSDLDTPATIVYEAPDGTLKAFKRDRKPEFARLKHVPGLRDPKA